MKFLPGWGEIGKIKKMKSFFFWKKNAFISLFYSEMMLFLPFFWCLKQDFLKNEVVLIIDVHF